MRDCGGTRSFWTIVLIAGGLSACRASVSASAKVNASETQVDEDHKWEIAENPSPSTEAPPAVPPPATPRIAAAVSPAPAPSGDSLLGVVHDLSMSSAAPRSPSCRCLAVAYGPPKDAKFTWQAGAPTAEQNALAIAISTDGVACPSGKPPVRLSISAIEHEGTDIVVVVENVSEGRPIMRGALAAWSGPNGAIVVRSRRGKPYPAASGPEPCRIPLK